MENSFYGEDILQLTLAFRRHNQGIRHAMVGFVQTDTCSQPCEGWINGRRWYQ
jgi:hypothetical protein